MSPGDDRRPAPIPDWYPELLDAVAGRVQAGRQRAIAAANQELVATYWQVGSEIVARMEFEGWGARVVDRLAADLRDRLHLSLLFVTHDLRVAAQLCDKVIVMSKGEIVEAGPTARVFAHPEHPYTRSLLDSIPGRDWEPPVRNVA